MITLKIAALVLGAGVLFELFSGDFGRDFRSRRPRLLFVARRPPSQRTRDVTGILCSDAELMHRLPTGGAATDWRRSTNGPPSIGASRRSHK